MTMPEPIQPIEPPKEKKIDDGFTDMFRGVKEDDLSDLTDVTDEDVTGAPDDEDIIETGDITDLFSVTKEDVVGRQRKRKPAMNRPNQPIIYRPNLPPTIGGVR